MLDKCKNGQCACEQEENFFHIKVIPQNSANFSAADEETFSSYEFESNTLTETDSMGREKFWEDMGRP
jgi:hypothetical protein